MVTDAASQLIIRPRTRRWAHLSLCALDAVFSIGARYTSTVRTCERYAAAAKLTALVDVGCEAEVIGTDAEQPLSVFVGDMIVSGPESFAANVLRNRQRTSPRGGVLKSVAAARYAEILVGAGVERYADVPSLVADELRLTSVEAQLREVPGNGASDIRLGYLWMLLGDDTMIKPDRMVHRWLGEVIGRRLSDAEARDLVAAVAAERGCTAWELDHAIWENQRFRRPVIGSDTATVRRHRAHQGRWRDEVLDLPVGEAIRPQVTASIVDSMLPAVHDGASAADAGWNLMSEAAVAYTRARVPVVQAAEGVVETDRLWRNMLSSQPLAFSLVGELRAHPDAALAVLSELSGHDLVAFDHIGANGGAWALDGMQAEWAPPRHEHTGDRSGFDIAAALRASDGRRVLITIEVKYTDRFSTKALEAERYVEALSAVGLDTAATAQLVKAGASQFLRSVLLTNSVLHGGRSGVEPLDAVLAVVLGRDDDSTAREIVELVAAKQTVVPVAWWALGTFLNIASKHDELAEWADAVGARYLLPNAQDALAGPGV